MIMAKNKNESSETVAYLQVKFKDNENPKAFKITNIQAALNRVEGLLPSWAGRWEWAVLRLYKSNIIYHYYHPNKGRRRLTKEQYYKELEVFSLYIVPTSAWKRKNNLNKGFSVTVKTLDEVPSHDNPDVLRILIYQKGEQINTYEKGKFLK